MDQGTGNTTGLDARRDALRARLRTKCEQIVAAVEALPDPTTFLEAERISRAILVADKMVERVFSEPWVAKEKMQLGGFAYGNKGPYLHRAQVSAHLTKNAPSGPLGHLHRFAAEDEMDENLSKEGETSLSKTYLKIEQIAAKIAAMDAKYYGQKSTKHGP